MADEVHISVTEVVVLTGKKTGFKLIVDGKEVTIPVDATIFAHYLNQFAQKNRTPLQKQRFSTLMNLMRAAYKKGKTDGPKAE